MNHDDFLESVIIEVAEGVMLNLLVQPRASHNQLVEVRGNELKVRLTSPPVDGSANRLCIDYMAKILGIPKSRVSITRGEKSRHKTIKITGVEKASVLSILQSHGIIRGCK
jgi:uncharacterized protein (TIGR00251 family)